MTKIPLITVIVPVYNVETCMRKCIESIRRQTYENLEIILSDDGSTDGSPAICDEYEKIDSRIKVIHAANGGVSAARNRGLEIAQGEYIGFVDADDWIARDMYEKLYSNLRGGTAQISIIGYAMVWENGAIQKMSSDRKSVILDHDKAMKEWITQGLFKNFMCDKLYDKKLFENVRFPEERAYMEDVAVGLSLFEQCETVIYSGEIGYYYFQRNGSATNSGFEKREFDGLDDVDKMLIYSKNQNGKFDTEVNARYVMLVFTIIDRMIYSKKKDYYDRLPELKSILMEKRCYVHSGYINFFNQLFIQMVCMGVPYKLVVSLRHCMLNLRRSVLKIKNKSKHISIRKL